MKRTKVVEQYGSGIPDEYDNRIQHEALTVRTKRGAEFHHTGSYSIKHAKHWALGESISKFLKGK